MSVNSFVSFLCFFYFLCLIIFNCFVWLLSWSLVFDTVSLIFVLGTKLWSLPLCLNVLNTFDWLLGWFPFDCVYFVLVQFLHASSVPSVSFCFFQSVCNGLPHLISVSPVTTVATSLISPSLFIPSVLIHCQLSIVGLHNMSLWLSVTPSVWWPSPCWVGQLSPDYFIFLYKSPTASCPCHSPPPSSPYSKQTLTDIYIK